MHKVAKILAMFSLVSAMGFAESVDGKLIDAVCHDAQKDRDENRNAAPKCVPTAATTSFAIEAADGSLYSLDVTSNAKAATFFKAAKSPEAGTVVKVNGKLSGHDFKVESIESR